MASQSEIEQLEDVYSAEDVEDVARTYDDWSKDYDAQMQQAGYRHPMICMALLTRYTPRRARPLLDAGVGTGLVGEWLKILDYPRVEGFDVSRGMLAVAEGKGVYDDLRRAVLGERLPYDDGYFAAAICAGVFTLGHAGPDGLDDLLRIVRPGGHLVITVKDKLYEDGFAEHLDGLIDAGRCALTEVTPSYLSMPHQSGQSTSRALVLETARG